MAVIGVINDDLPASSMTGHRFTDAINGGIDAINGGYRRHQ